MYINHFLKTGASKWYEIYFPNVVRTSWLTRRTKNSSKIEGFCCRKNENYMITQVLNLSTQFGRARNNQPKTAYVFIAELTIPLVGFSLHNTLHRALYACEIKVEYPTISPFYELARAYIGCSCRVCFIRLSLPRYLNNPAGNPSALATARASSRLMKHLLNHYRLWNRVHCHLSDWRSIRSLNSVISKSFFMIFWQCSWGMKKISITGLPKVKSILVAAAVF